MKKTNYMVKILAQASLIFLFSSLYTVHSDSMPPLQIVVSVAPQRYFVEKIGGDQVKVDVLLLPGHNPTTFSPVPAQLVTLSNAVLYYRTGLPFEAAGMARIRGINPNMEILDARDGLDLIPMRADHAHQTHANQESHPKQEMDPHIWLNPQLVAKMATQLAKTLSRLRPEKSALFDHNLQKFQRELDQLNRDIQLLLSQLKNRQMMVFHPSWGYFARQYGLIQTSIEVNGKMPGVKILARTIDQGKKASIQTIFVQPQFDHKRAATVAQAIGAKLIILDPLAENYMDNLRQVARIIGEQ